MENDTFLRNQVFQEFMLWERNVILDEVILYASFPQIIEQSLFPLI